MKKSSTRSQCAFSMSTHQYKVYSTSFPQLGKSSFVVLKVPLESQTQVLIKSCFVLTARGSFSKSLIFQAITSVDLSSGSNFTKGNDSLLSASLRSSFAGRRVPFKNNLAHQQRMEKKADPLPPSKCNADLKGGALLWSLSHTQQAHPEIFILLSNTLSPRRRGNGKNLKRTRHFVEVSQSLKESLSSVSYTPRFFMETED